MKILFCSAIEASGDALLAPLIKALKSHHPHLRCVGIGGPLSQAEGLELWIDPKPLVAHGFVEALRHIPRIWKELRGLKRKIRTASYTWNGALFVDSPEINLRLKKTFESLHVPIAYLAPPQAWAWRSHRAKAFRNTAWLGCLFPFEAQWWREQGCKVYELGHPLRLSISPSSRKGSVGSISASHHVSSGDSIRKEHHLAFFPGSRNSAIKRSLPLLLHALPLLNDSLPIHLHIAQSAWVNSALLEKYQKRFHLLLSKNQGSCTLHLHSLTQPRIQQDNENEKREIDASKKVPVNLLYQASHALCYAGTSTLEIALHHVPFLTIAPLHPLSAWLAHRWIKVSHIALPNLILKKRVFRELHPHSCTPQNLASALHTLLASPPLKPQVWQDLESQLPTPHWNQAALDLSQNLTLF